MMVMMFMFIVIFFCCFIQLSNPTCTFINFFKVKFICSQYIFNWNICLCCFNYTGIWLKDFNNSTDFFKLLFCNKVSFINNQCITEFNLLNKKTFNIFFTHIFFKKSISFIKLCSHTHSIHYRNYPINIAVINLLNSLCNWHWFTYTTSFNQNIIKLFSFNKFFNLVNHITFEVTANTTILKCYKT